MVEIKQTAVIGAGVIGASWTALFLAAGMDAVSYTHLTLPTICSV